MFIIRFLQIVIYYYYYILYDYIQIFKVNLPDIWKLNLCDRFYFINLVNYTSKVFSIYFLRDLTLFNFFIIINLNFYIFYFTYVVFIIKHILSIIKLNK